ncbi:MAG: hypothetical protein BGO78_08075 [Chloroflexi bacterium 44-23]|nr:MAG: hypothetical protein BGO78_08075 [Chloroflexi bacterium 44-23]
MLEFDPDRSAILNPDMIHTDLNAPLKAVPCFFYELMQELWNKGELKLFTHLKSELGNLPLYLYQIRDQEILVYQAGLGAPLSAGMLEEVIALGSRQFIVCGGCGVLDDHVDVGHPFILTGAVRDEGVSYHYLPASREVNAHPSAVKALQDVLASHHISYNLSKTWTTDAIYRETTARRARRLEEGCEVVEMEAAAFFAVAQFRQVVLGQIVYGGDLVKPEGWDKRNWSSRSDTRRLLFDLAVEAVLRI